MIGFRGKCVPLQPKKRFRTMINRTLIRLKIVQLVYAFYQNGGKQLELAEKDLTYSLHKAYELYQILLLLPAAVTRYASNALIQRRQLNQITHREEILDTHFVDNRFVQLLEENMPLRKFHSTLEHTWDDESSYLNQLYKDILASPLYQDYMACPTTTFEQDKELWCQIYKQIIMKDERLDDLLEEQNLFWNDDRNIVDTFVLKTLKKFTEGQDAKTPLLPEYKSEDDADYAIQLFRATIKNNAYYRDLIGSCLRNWEFNRLAFMDVIIMQVALAEIIEFPLIPVPVTINEFVEIAKYYSTPNSGSYINGILDAVSRRLYNEGQIQKEMPATSFVHHDAVKPSPQKADTENIE